MGRPRRTQGRHQHQSKNPKMINRKCGIFQKFPRLPANIQDLLSMTTLIIVTNHTAATDLIQIIKAIRG